MGINKMNQMYGSLGVRREVREFTAEMEQTLKERSESIDAVAEYNQMKVIKGVQDDRVSNTHFAATTGYGYNSLGHDTLEDVYANVFHGESALMHPQFMSDTHALRVALSGNLRPGDEFSSPVSKPYDTLEEVIGIRDPAESLKEHRVSHRQVKLLGDGSFDYEDVTAALSEKTKPATIQHSKSYVVRLTLPAKWIGELISFIRNIEPDVIYTMDNYYGESAETIEPADVGVDMIVGSLVRNPGSGLAPIGGYIMGRKDCIERTSYHLSAPGLGKEVGAGLGLNQQLYQGLFLSPVVVSEALEGVVFTAGIYEQLGCVVVPNGSEPRYDIIQAITSGTPEGVISFCRRIQAVASVDSYMIPEPWGVPGYDSPIITAADAFVQGSSIEFSADGPIKPLYAVYFQGRLAWYHVKLGILRSL